MPSTIMLILSPYGIILDTSPCRKVWHGQPLMRFVHSDDLIRLCGSLSAAYKQQLNNNIFHINDEREDSQDSPLEVRITTSLYNGEEEERYRWYELIVVESEPQLQIIVQPSRSSSRRALSYDDEKQSWMHHAVENGVTIVAHALGVLVQLLEDHAGYQLKNIPYELTDRMLSMLAWTGLIKDMGLAKAIVDKLLDQCLKHIACYMDQALEHSNPGLCKAIV
ncbi:hypothetical protein BDB00DRAFT_798407 [Zychaea mexicana]|uniref:uncharacterized protein n=1 Tax=Zychaea mexicana TaxID=64656 RepID=UPI0022FF02FC|nr:uncharacterized protein BDB00DRAFT_798407 [Zychaea mexicana]KAI9498545.1 hypothetical protein BDB00DRAFT_798407 [Zychaea mexicana]